ncbi:sulfatase family protein [Nocardioides marmoribigeumensis]|uniref:Arylsulfatase A-like enzyme n=1 Tax=Nocardioides marmoribigeumensis TaxID=433649 RepID=A0ABU2BUB3_9ACTN|nr:sulfatase [Nocardioides marmoribigeumensis]MDR7362213.1 arylsulfatase A-like enzyme [Nocardioides marmoribigeumensis]
MARRESLGVRTWAAATAVVAGLVAAGLAVLVSPTLGAGSDHRSPRAATTLSVPADGPRRVTPVGDPAARARFGPKPNVVVVMTDDMRADDLRFMPTVRRELRQGGVEFRNSFSPNPLCCPARASFLSGQLSHNHGVISQVPPWGFPAFRDHGTIATALRRSGYRTALVGKYLNGYGELRRRNGEPSLHYVPPGWTDWYAAFGPPPSSRMPGGTYNYLDQPINHDGRIEQHRGQYSTVTTGTIATRLVDRYSRSRDPFFMYLAFVAPHFGTPHEPDDPTYTEPDGVRQPLGTPYVPAWVRGRFDRMLTKAPGFGGDADPSETDISDKPPFMRNRPEPNGSMEAATLESARQRAESLYVVDRQVARLVHELKQRGEWQRTVLFLTSDNGFFLGEHRHLKGKIKPYEPSTRVPLLVTGPGLRSGTTRSDPVTTVDLTATILELGRAIPYLTSDHPLDGTSRLTTLLDGDQGWRAPVVTEGRLWQENDRRVRRANGFHTGLSYAGLRTPRYAYMRYDRGYEELYDLREDANEMVNRIEDPMYADVVARLRRLWTEYHECAGPQCRRDLPRWLRAGPDANAELTSTFWAQVAERSAATLTR